MQVTKVAQADIQKSEMPQEIEILSNTDLAAIAGGLNPQPLPPGRVQDDKIERQ